MNKTVLIAISLLMAAVIAGWSFFTYGGETAKPTKEQQLILETKDERLSMGEPQAPVRIVEYGDILCPYCAKAHQQVVPKIQSNYIEKDKVHYEMRLVGMIAEDSKRAAEGAYCAGEQNKFWDYIDAAYRYTWENYYRHDKDPSEVTLFSSANMPKAALELGVFSGTDNIQWQNCVEAERYEETINSNRSDMSKLKAYGTPHFVIDGKGYNGAPPFSAFKAVIEAALNENQAKQ